MSPSTARLRRLASVSRRVSNTALFGVIALTVGAIIGRTLANLIDDGLIDSTVQDAARQTGRPDRLRVAG